MPTPKKKKKAPPKVGFPGGRKGKPTSRDAFITGARKRRGTYFGSK